jgi:hypothetical protein
VVAADLDVVGAVAAVVGRGGVAGGLAEGGAACPEGLESKEEVGGGAEGVETPLVASSRVGGAEVRDDPSPCQLTHSFLCHGGGVHTRPRQGRC